MSLKLSEFVSDTITEIMLGVKDARQRASELGLSASKISPVLAPRQPTSDAGNQYFLNPTETSEHYGSAQMISFDVAVEARDNAEVGAKVGVISGVFNLGGDGKTLVEEKSISRLQFRIPVDLS